MSNCIVTGGSKNDTAPIAVLLMNIKATQSWVDHVIVFHDGISVKNQKLMQQIMPVEFIEYHFPGNKKNFNEIVKYVYTEMVFCKYECLKLLEHYDYVIWTDYDVIFQRGVGELLDFKDDSSGFKLMISDNEQYQSFAEQIKKQGRSKLSIYCPLDLPSVNTCLMVLSRIHIPRFRKLYDECIDFTEKYGNYLILPEQAVFDMVLYQNQITPEAIPWCYATRPTGNPTEKKAPILHSIAQPKFWNGLHNKTWQENYETWKMMGGASWKPISPFSWRNIAKKWLFLKNKLLQK